MSESVEDLLVCIAADLVGISEHCHLQVRLYHSTAHNDAHTG